MSCSFLWNINVELQTKKAHNSYTCIHSKQYTVIMDDCLILSVYVYGLIYIQGEEN